MNKYRISIMLTLIIILLLYMLNVVSISEVSNFAVTCSSLLFSISCALDTFARKNKLISGLRFVIDTSAICSIILIPIIKDGNIVKNIMNVLDTNVLLLLALFFTMAGQWATEIKIKDIQNHKK